MSLSKEQMIELMKYADGELATDEREAVKAKLASSIASPSSDEARVFLAELSNLAGWVEEAEAVSIGAAADSFDIADAVMAKLDAQDAKGASADDDSRIAETTETTEKIGPKTDSKRPAIAAVAVSSIEVAREKRNRVFVVVATALAMAAGIALLLRHPAEAHKAASGMATNGIATTHPLDKLAVPSARANLSPASSEASQTLANAGDKAGEPGVEVDVVATDSSQTGVSVFYLPGTSSTAASAVVWINDDQGGK